MIVTMHKNKRKGASIMKKIGIFMLAVLLLLSLFSGCGSNPSEDGSPTPPPPTEAPATSAPQATTVPTKPTDTPTTSAPQETPEPTPVEPASHLAPGKVALDANGIPNERYDYELPLTEDDVTFSCWTTVWFPQFLGDPDYNRNEFVVEEANRTGVHINYSIISSGEMATNFAVLLASESLLDIMAKPDSYYPGSALSAIEDNYFINILDYKEYCPNYMYIANKYAPEDKVLHDSIYLNKDNILCFWSVMEDAVPSNTFQARTDWLEKVGLTVDDIRTVEDFINLCEVFRSQIDTAIYPLHATASALDVNHFFACYDFYTGPGAFPGAANKNGSAEFYFRNDDAKAYVEMFREFFARGFVDPNWNNSDSWAWKENVYAGKTGIVTIAVDEIPSYTAMIDDPDADFHVLHKVVRYQGQMLHLGNDATHRFYGTTGISTSCENIPLAVSWCDWRYSPSGSDYASWGIQGLTWDYNDEGIRELTEFVTNNPYGAPISWCMTMWGMNRFADHGLASVEVQYAFPAARNYYQMVSWQVNEFAYDGAYEWPRGATLDTEEKKEFASLCTDMSTYIQEHITMFVTGDAPMSEWDNYIQALYEMNLAEGEAIYTTALQRYLNDT